MALTVTDVVPNVNLEGASPGTGKGIRVADVTFDNSYLADGEAITAAMLQLSTIDFLLPTVKQGATLLDTEVFYDHTAGALIAVVGSTGVEVANAVDLSAVVVRVLAIGNV